MTKDEAIVAVTGAPGTPREIRLVLLALIEQTRWPTPGRDSDGILKDRQ